jgi:hypothetical protein
VHKATQCRTHGAATVFLKKKEKEKEKQNLGWKHKARKPE